MNIIALIIVAIILLTVLLLVLLLRRRKQTMKLTSDEYNLLIQKKFGRFDLRSFLVRGDFNTTFEALDPDRNKLVAIRVLDRKYIYNDSVVQQFNLKGEMLNYLSARFPGNCFVQNISYGIARVEDEPRPYIVSDMVPGISLAAVLEKCGRLSPRDVYKIIMQTGEAVSQAHSQRIWIRELAPQNILLRIDESGNLIATLANVGVQYRNLPSESAVEAKRGYYSPEDRKGESVDERSDIYALAALTFSCLEGYDLSLRQEGEAWRGATGILEPALADDPRMRTSTVESFLKSLHVLQTAQSTVKDQKWSVLIPRILKSRASVKVQRTSAETLERGADRRRRAPVIGKATKERLVSAFISGLVAAVVLWLAKKIEGIFASPKKAFTVAVVGIVGLALALWYFVFSPPKTTVSIATEPIGAAVTINGIQIGATTPVENESVDSGKVAIKVQKRGFFTVDTSVVLGRGQHADISLALRPAAVLSISVNPVDAIVVLDKDTIGSQQLANLETSVGKHTLSITRAGYLPEVRELNLPEGTKTPLVYTLKVNEAKSPRLAITCDPLGGQLFINDQLVGALPYENYDLQPGGYQIKILLEGYVDFTEGVTVQPGKTATVEAKLVQAGSITLSGQPADALVSMDGKELSEAEKGLKSVAVGRHRLKFKKDGFRDLDTAVTVSFKQATPLSYRMVPFKGRVTILVKPYGTIYFDDGVLKTDATAYTEDLPAGRHKLKVVHPTYGFWEKELNIAADKDLRIPVDFNRFVSITVISLDEAGNSVRGAEIFVDNTTTSKFTPAQVSVRTGFHTLEVRKEGYLSAAGPVSGVYEEDLRDPMKFTLKKK